MVNTTGPKFSIVWNINNWPIAELIDNMTQSKTNFECYKQKNPIKISSIQSRIYILLNRAFFDYIYRDCKQKRLNKTALDTQRYSRE